MDFGLHYPEAHEHTQADFDPHTDLNLSKDQNGERRKEEIRGDRDNYDPLAWRPQSIGHSCPLA